MNFHVSLTKERSAALEKAQIHINGLRGVNVLLIQVSSLN